MTGSHQHINNYFKCQINAEMTNCVHLNNIDDNVIGNAKITPAA
jgi:hypothetical protein